MIWVALGSTAVLAVTVVAFCGLLRSLSRQQARERDLLLNQLLNLAGRPWQPPPSLSPEPALTPWDEAEARFQDPDQVLP